MTDTGRPERSVVVYTDGGSRHNPGPAAIGVAIYDRQSLGRPTAEAGEPFFQLGLHIGKATNNVAEYMALIRGLEEARKAGATSIEVRADSELLIKQMNGEYQVRNEGIRPLYSRARALSLGVRVRFVHVRREANRLADRLVNRALDEWERSIKDEDNKCAGEEDE